MTATCRLGSEWKETFVRREMGVGQGQMPGREEERRSSEDEQEQDKASQQVALSGQAGAMKALQ